MGQMDLSKFRPRKVPGPLIRRDAASVTRESYGSERHNQLRRMCGAFVVSLTDDNMAVKHSYSLGL
ncbi:hypothetical protein AALP_AA5G289500 [Arabis alpina]|uniref:Uncharacterized protein n=1 Tax=Arabis alpina TaxID=50452 RepID=A0A087H026_ARAAL|nr:hypothetical protein AALP_AA5G289500 [Arabis alpina]